ncbi:MAG: hypothetical protein GY679_02075 [Mycoplasma sp.]|nr:hypothetical protein [Mycoplasma sp.]
MYRYFIVVRYRSKKENRHKEKSFFRDVEQPIDSRQRIEDVLINIAEELGIERDFVEIVSKAQIGRPC